MPLGSAINTSDPFTVEGTGIIEVVNGGTDTGSTAIIEGQIEIFGTFNNKGTLIFDIDAAKQTAGKTGSYHEGATIDLDGSTGTGRIEVKIDDSLTWTDGDVMILLDGVDGGSFTGFNPSYFSFYDYNAVDLNSFWAASTITDANGHADLIATFSSGGPTPIPEPETYALMGSFALLTLLFSRKREKRATVKSS